MFELDIQFDGSVVSSMLVHLSTLRFALGSSRIQFWMGASDQRLGPRISTKTD